jgi:DNA primase
MPSTVDQIKDRLDITDVVGSYIKLDPAGSNFKARCPFHNEKTPSFFVSPSRQTYHCFGCNVGGDIFSFVQEIEGIDFPGALRVLADRAGVEIKKEYHGTRSDKDNSFAVLEDATNFFEGNLKEQKEVIDYLKKRGLTGETAKRFKVGYAPAGWSNLYDFLKSKGYSDVSMEKVGLIVKGDKGYYDRFRSRIMFPIADISGRVVGFSGRIFGAEDEKTAKYVNSPETELFNKSKILYGFDKAKLAIRKNGFCILVEGQMDLLMSHQAGFANTVAASGTALTEEHLKLIKRLTDNLVFAFDADDAGVSASKRGVDSALSLDLDVKIVLLPSGSDPADLILKDKSMWEMQIKEAQHIIDFYINTLANKGLEQREFRVKVGELVLPYVARLKNKINQAHFVTEIARKLGISEEPVWEELKGVSVDNKQASESNTQGNVKKATAQLSRREMLERKIMGIILWQKEADSHISGVDDIEEKYKEIINSVKKRHVLDDEKRKEYIFEAEVYYGDTEKIKEELEALILYLEEEILKGEFTSIMSSLRTAENKGDTQEAAKFLKQCQEISKKINSLK